MVQSNPHFQKLRREYIFPIIEKKLQEVKALYPDADILNAGIGDVSLPLAPCIADAIAKATLEMSSPQSIRGYGPSEGYLFLRETIAEHEYPSVGIDPDEVFISDGINTDIANTLELFDSKTNVAIPDPTYPVYLDSSLLAGREVRLMPCTENTGFLPLIPQEKIDILYLCSPSNPTGVAMNKSELTAFVNYAIKNGSIILYDNAYSAFITSQDIPKSIYEIPGADTVAIEFRSFSKSAGFTGLRCGYTVVPKGITVYNGQQPVGLHSLWKKRQSIKSNGVSYPIQKGAQSCFTQTGKEQTSNQVKNYLQSARILREGLHNLKQTFYGGIDAPYIWWKVPSCRSSWEFFDILLKQCQIIAIPGLGFGSHGEGFIRLSSFMDPVKAYTAVERIKTIQYEENI